MKIISKLFAIICVACVFVILVLDTSQPEWFTWLVSWAAAALVSGLLSAFCYNFNKIKRYICAAIYVIATDVFGYRG